MGRKAFSPVFCVTLVFLCSLAGLSAQTVTWTGLGSSNNNNIPENWLGNTLPLNNGTEEFIFGPAARSTVIFYYDVFARKVSIVGNNVPYRLDDDYGDITIGSDGLVYAPAAPVTSILGAYNVIVPDDQTWNIQSGRFEVEYYMNGAGQITKTGAGDLVFRESYNADWTGGLVLSAGRVVIGPYDGPTQALGSGILTFNGGSLMTSDLTGYAGSTVEIENLVVSNGLISTVNDNELHFAGLGGSGESVTLNANTTIQSQGKPLHIMGAVIEDTAGLKLIIDSQGAVVLHGSSGWTGGTDVNQGVLIFAGEDNTPGLAGGILVNPLGYAGITLDQNVGGFLSQVNPASTGAIGFDSDPDLPPDTFTSPIDLTGFNASLRLGSATHAILGSAAVITPQGTSYRFGGGGGRLEVQSVLTDAAGPVARSVVLDSLAQLPLTVRFTSGGNTLTGGVSATHSAAVFGSTSLPGTGTLTLGSGGYIGAEDIIQGSGLSQAFIDRFASTTDRGMIGFDAASEHVTVNDNLSLAGFADASPGILLGTASSAVFNGTITPQGSTYRFGAYKGGQLTVNSTLSGAGNAVQIGDPGSLGTMGDFFMEEYSTVRLAGDNTHGGGTTLYTGRLDLGHANALGTGTLVVQPHSLSLPAGGEDVMPQLTADSGLTIANALQLNSDLNIGGNDSGFTLSGPISGAGELYLEGDYFDLTLSGSNGAFSGGIYLSGSNTVLTLGSNNAAGTGPLGFGFSYAPDVYFATSAPVIGGLRSNEESDYAYLYAQLTNTELTINQPFDSRFRGEFRSNAIYPDDTLRIVKNGSGTLRLDDGGMYFYHGTTEPTLPGTPEVNLQINQGTVVIGSSFYVEGSAPTVWVHGGTLALDGGYLGNPVVVDNGGRLAGNGYYDSALHIGTGATLAPGFANQGGTGMLEIAELFAEPGGTYEWNLQSSADAQTAPHDMIAVVGFATLDFSGIDPEANPIPTSANRFTLKAISLNAGGTPGLAGGFVNGQTYTWNVFYYNNLDAVFDPAKILIDSSLFVTNLGAGAAAGTFSITDNTGILVLNFVAVPEPSTYALLALGLGAVLLPVLRRQRRA